jgi:hypothetical protein
MAYNFRTLSVQEALALIAASADPLVASEGDGIGQFGRADTQLASVVRKFLSGNHWQDGDAWIGPRPIDPVTGALDTNFMKLVEERFTSRNMLAEVTTRHNDGVVGREPQWMFTVSRPLEEDEDVTGPEQTALDTIENELTVWWNKRQCYQLFQRVTPEMITSGRAVIRLFVPAARLAATPGVFDETENEGQATVAAPATVPARAPAPRPQLVRGQESDAPTTVADEPSAGTTVSGVYAPTIADALDHIFVEVVIADDAAVYTDLDSMEQVGIVRYREQGIAPGTIGPQVVETTFLDGDASMPLEQRNTIIRIVSANEEEEPPVALPLGGHLMHYAATRPPLLTRQIVSLQKALNLAITMLPRNVETSGFRERIITNAQLPGEYEYDAHGNKVGFKLGQWMAGPGVTMFAQGTEIVQEDTTKSLANPGVTVVEPAPVDPTVAAIDALSREILREAKQSHILGTDQAQSGISRQQARADFGKSLGRSQAALEPAGRWLLETVLYLAVLFAEDAQGIDPTAFRCDFRCVIDTGPLDPREIQTAVTAYSAGIVSAEYAMEEMQVEDTDAELARMNAEPGKRQALRLSMAQTLKAYVDAGLTLAAAAQLAGFSKDDIALITKDEQQNPLEAPAPLFKPDGTPMTPEEQAAAQQQQQQQQQQQGPPGTRKALPPGAPPAPPKRQPPPATAA